VQSFEESFEWQEQFFDHMAEIATRLTRRRRGTWDEDVHKATDLILAAQAEIAFSLRARSREFARFGDVTVRYDRPSGRPTEWRKTIDAEDGPAFGIYGYDSGTAGKLSPWILYSWQLVREHVRNCGHPDPIPNKDGSSRFVALDPSRWPPGCIIANESWPVRRPLTGFADRRRILYPHTPDEAGEPRGPGVLFAGLCVACGWATIDRDDGGLPRHAREACGGVSPVSLLSRTSEGDL